jgi:hypothetical protein
MSPLTLQRLDLANWVLIYAGMALATVGLFVSDSDVGWSAGLLIVGVVLLALGVGGVLLRASRRDSK